MKPFNHVVIDENSRVPKYRQVVGSVIENISTGKLSVGEKIPSINALSEEFGLSRDTVEKAYKILKERKVIVAVKGKGFYVTRTQLIAKVNVLFLVNKLSSYKMQVFEAFRQEMAPSAHVDLQVYHCEESLFLQLFHKYRSSYDHYVIMPHFKTAGLRHVSAPESVLKALREIPPHKLTILDNKLADFPGSYTLVYQDFQQDLYRALKDSHDRIRQYKRLLIAYPEQSIYPYPHRILRGFRQYCVEVGIDFEILATIREDTPICEGDLYVTVPEQDLVNLVKLVRDRGWQPGREIGIISYNETPLKELLGITTFSTDFKEMGRLAARSILQREQPQLKNTFRVTHRSSL